MTRRTNLTLLAAAMAAGSPAADEDIDTMKELFEASQKEKKGMMIYVAGQAIPGVVVKIEDETIELRSREYSRIVVRTEAIDAVALS